MPAARLLIAKKRNLPCGAFQAGILATHITGGGEQVESVKVGLIIPKLESPPLELEATRRKRAPPRTGSAKADAPGKKGTHPRCGLEGSENPARQLVG